MRNGVNYQGFRELLQDPTYDDVESADTRPASIDSADLLAMWMETDYDTVVERDGDDTIAAVRHEPIGLRVSIETTAPASPTFGPTVVFRVPAMVGGCGVFLQAYVSGPASAPTDTPEQANMRKLDEGCPGGAGTVSDGFDLEFDGNVMTLVYPFDAPAAEGLLVPGRQLMTDGDMHNRPLWVEATAPAIDEATGFWWFRAGEDVPDDVDCAATPEADRCQE